MLKLFAMIGLLVIGSTAQASIYRCVDASGKQSFSSRPCAEGQELIEHRLSESERQRIREEEQRQAQQEAVTRELTLWSRADRTDTVANSGWDTSVKQVKDYLSRTLRDPDSLQTIEWGPVLTKQGQEYRVRYQYRAKNALGGYVISDQVFIMNSRGDVIRVVDYNGTNIIFH